MNTQKKMKVVGVETFVNARTGEYHELNVVEVEDRDANFVKLWVSSILSAVDELSNQRMKIVFWLVNEASRSRNVIVKTTRDLAKEIGVSRTTVHDTLKILEKHDILRRKTGVIFMSPNVVYKGTRGGRLEILTRYNKLPAPKKEDQTVEERADQLSKRMDFLAKEMERVRQDLRELETYEDSAAE